MAVNATVENQPVITASLRSVSVPNAGSSGATYIKGDKGDPGEAATITVGETTTLPAGSDATVTNSGTSSNAIFDFGIPTGANGADGQDGEDGFSPTVSSETITGGHRITIVDADGSTTVDVMDGIDGQDGADGTDGVDGFSPTIVSAPITGGHQLTITDVDGTTTVNVMDGEDGTDGRDGQDGVGVPSGGSSNEVLKKKSNTDYDTEWGTVEALPTGGTTGQVLRKKTNTNYDVEWADESGAVLSVDGKTGNVTVLPTGGAQGKYLRKSAATDYAVAWQDASIVHVGASAPTDSDVQIWLDTDEPGMSAVSSVNGHSGTVVLDADDVGAVAWVKLWENASPMSTFAAQDISLDLSAYQFLKIGFKWYTGDSSTATIWQDFKVGEKGMAFRTELGAYVCNRVVTVDSSSVSFSACNQSHGTSSASTTNQALVPTEIYGIKGVNST